MNETANPVFIALLFILRCLVPLLVLFGVSYLLRRLGLVVLETPAPEDAEREEDDEDEEDSEYEDDSSSDNKES